MANWAALQETLIAKPVVKRAKHGIHFQDGKQITAVFSGKPCHYFDGKLWKPIDTKLVAVGTEYGAPGLNPRITTGGLVRIDGTNYSQQSTRIGIFNPTTKAFSAIKTIPLGSLDEDKLIAESGVWRRELRLTEDGLKEEIIIASKPTNTGATLQDWLVLETAVSGVSFPDGWLNDYEVGEFKFKTPSAHDSSDQYSLNHNADCKRYARTVGGVQYIYTGVSAVWLNNAVYPVVIDPDFSITSTAGDTRILASADAVEFNYGASTIIAAGRFEADINVQRSLLRFDISSVSGSISAASLTIYIADDDYTYQSTLIDVYEISAANGDWIQGTKNGTRAGSGEPCWEAKEANGSGGVTTAWAGSQGCGTAGTDYVDDVIGTFTVPNPDNLNAAVTTALTASVVQDWITTNPGILFKARTESGSNQGIHFYTSEYSTTGYRPLLTVTYTSGKHFLPLLGVGK